ncbi:unnamed protein product [Dovyalis caffra]|uniref:Antifreeze protein n=1 Tax=Dovyalis caffra TaxID=77055 RepID=A0AAV1R7C0_9ROSI|nr:unnamed protein product [Dovyalis caffra]
MITTRALREARAAAYISMVTIALDGVAALWSLQPAAMTITAAAPMSIPSVTLKLEPAECKNNPFGVKALTRAPARITQSHHVGGERRAGRRFNPV